MGRGDVFLAFIGGLIAGSVISRMFRAYRDWKVAEAAVPPAWKAFRWLMIVTVVGVFIAITALRASESSSKPHQPAPTTTTQQSRQ